MIFIQYTQIRINFLPVGHTHEDVDQMFNCIGSKIQRVGADTLQGKLSNLYTIHITVDNKFIATHAGTCRANTNSHNYFFADLVSAIAGSYTPNPQVEIWRVWLTTSRSWNIQSDNCITTQNLSVSDFSFKKIQARQSSTIAIQLVESGSPMDLG